MSNNQKEPSGFSSLNIKLRDANGAKMVASLLRGMLIAEAAVGLCVGLLVFAALFHPAVVLLAALLTFSALMNYGWYSECRGRLNAHKFLTEAIDREITPTIDKMSEEGVMRPVYGCPQCGKDHEAVRFRKLHKDWSFTHGEERLTLTHWGWCLETASPILFHLTKEELGMEEASKPTIPDEPPIEVVSEGLERLKAESKRLKQGAGKG